MRRICIVLALAAAIVLLKPSAAQEELDPAKLAPDVQRVVFENRFVRVMEERMPPGRGVGKHRHGPGVTVALADYQMEQKMLPSGQIVHSNRRFGEINCTDGVLHEAKNVGKTNQYVVRVEIKY